MENTNKKQAIMNIIEVLKKNMDEPDNIFVGIQFTEKHYLRLVSGQELIDMLVNGYESILEKE